MHLLLTLSSPTDVAIKTVPEIIKQASQSALGIFALLLVIVGFLAYAFFRKAPLRVKIPIFLVIVAGTAVYGLEINRISNKPEVIHYTGRVVDAKTQAPIHEAKVTVKMRDASPPLFTDSEGRYSFYRNIQDTKADARLLVTAEHYTPYDRIIPTDASSPLKDIRMTPLPVAMILTQKFRVVEASSGPKTSGVGAAWSPWYRASLGFAPAGYTFDHADFWLTGDRQCVAWAECRELAKNDQEVGFVLRPASRFRIVDHFLVAGPATMLRSKVEFCRRALFGVFFKARVVDLLGARDHHLGAV